MAAKARADEVDGKRGGERATAEKAASKAVRESPPDTYVNSMNGKRRPKYGKKGKLAKGYYLQELTALQEELVKLQYWVKQQNLKVAIVFEGRDAAGRAALSSGFSSAPTRASSASPRSASRPSESAASGTSNAGRRICQRRARSCSSIAAGTRARSPSM